jgi:hypothetical protein
MIDDIKKLLFISTNEFDEYLGVIVPILLDHAKDYCNNTFKKYDEVLEEYVDDIPKPVTLFIAKMAEQNLTQSGLKSESLGDYSVSFDTDNPHLKLLLPYRKVKFI